MILQTKDIASITGLDTGMVIVKMKLGGEYAAYAVEFIAGNKVRLIQSF